MSSLGAVFIEGVIAIGVPKYILTHICFPEKSTNFNAISLCLTYSQNFIVTSNLK